MSDATAIEARGNRATLAAFVLLLVVVAFARAHFASSTGIRIGGDGADYHAMAASLSLEGRAPFVYRPAVPLLVGALFGGDLMLGFVLVCALSMFAALYTAGTLARDGLAGYGIAAVLFFNYQVLFAAANPARIDVVVLAVQLGFVVLALQRRSTAFYVLLPLCALLKESLLLSLAALALIAFAEERDAWARIASSVLAFLMVHAAVRWLATPTAYMPPYDGSLPPASAVWQMLASNLSLLTPLDLFVAWGGLCCIVAWLLFSGETLEPGRATLTLRGATAFLLLFPLPLVTDVHRAWFELLAPMAFYFLLPRLNSARRTAVYPALALAMLASIIPYATRFIAGEHLYLLLLQRNLSVTAILAVVVSLAIAGRAIVYWRQEPSHAPGRG